MWIRQKKWRYNTTGMKVADPRQDCFFSQANEGLVDVRWKSIAERLLSHPLDFEIAYEKYGIVFDPVTGQQLEPATVTTAPGVSVAVPTTATTTAGTGEPVRRGRPPKRR